MFLLTKVRCKLLKIAEVPLIFVIFVDYDFILKLF